MKPMRDPEGVEIEQLLRTGAAKGRRVVEIGCGDGRLTWRYANLAASITGVDPDLERLAEMAATRPEAVSRPIPVVQSAAEKLPFAAETFDSALFSWSL